MQPAYLVQQIVKDHHRPATIISSTSGLSTLENIFLVVVV